MNWIQQYVLRELSLHPTRRYSQLKPKDVEGNVFSYHLQKAVKAGYIERHERLYSLTVKGRHRAGMVSIKTGKIRKQPKIAIMIIGSGSKGEYLLYRWHRHPFLNRVSFPYGKHHFGKSVFEMAALELQEKCNATGTLEHLGDLYIKTTVEDEIVTHMLVHAFKATGLKSDEFKSTDPTGECFWGRPEDITDRDSAPGFKEIYEVIKNPPVKMVEIETTDQ